MFIHHVFFRLNKPGDKEVRGAFEKGLKDLVKIDTIKMSQLGVPGKADRPVSDDSYTYSLLTVFENREDHDIYQDHPVHKKFIADCEQYWAEVRVFDSEDL